jgi:hypothetical protein
MRRSAVRLLCPGCGSDFDIGRLQITVIHALLMGGFDAFGNPAADFHGFILTASDRSTTLTSPLGRSRICSIHFLHQNRKLLVQSRHTFLILRVDPKDAAPFRGPKVARGDDLSGISERYLCRAIQFGAVRPLPHFEEIGPARDFRACFFVLRNSLGDRSRSAC